MWSDTIADMLARIKNAYLVKKTQVSIPYSKSKRNIAEVLKELDYLGSITVEQDKGNKELIIELKYKDSEPMIKKLERVSKPGRRVYVTHDKLPVVLSGYGSAIVSTSQGIMTADEARKKGLGGEVICKVW
jgi:small subunit ribosomal protein S8